MTDETYWIKTLSRLLDKTNISKSEKMDLNTEFIFNKEEIVEQLLNGTYEWSIPRKVEIRKIGTSKKRTVYIYDTKDRLVLGMLYHFFSEYFKDRISDNCYSYKTGQNTGRAIRFIKDYKPTDNSYGVKVDIHAYFNEISKDRIAEMLDELFDNEPEFMNIKQSLEKLLLNDECLYHGKLINEHKGIIPGTPLASFFANYCLNECDKYFDNTDTLYARYSDDIIIICDTKEKVDKGIEIIKDYIAKYGLEINPSKYKYFYPGEDITFLGLKLLNNGKVDMSDNSKVKIKKQIHRWCKKARKDMEMCGAPFMVVASKVNKRLNNKNFKCYINNEGTYGWCHYMFRYITTTESLKEIDTYTKNTIRALKTGKHNKHNYYAVSEEEFEQMGYVSLVQLYQLYKTDFDYYCEVISLL